MRKHILKTDNSRSNGHPDDPLKLLQPKNRKTGEEENGLNSS